MARRIAVLVSLVVFVIGLTGCATARRQKDLEIQGLKNQVSVLESQLQSKDEEINSLKDALAKQQEKETRKGLTRVSKKRAIAEVKSRPKTKQVQIALKNAGFYTATIDGKNGKLTREAIKAFQKANNLSVTGKTDRQTWALLKGYLYKKEK